MNSEEISEEIEEDTNNFNEEIEVRTEEIFG